MARFTDDLSQFLGTFLLPKYFRLFNVQGKAKLLLEEIHLCLQAFSICKLEYLATLPTYKVALTYFILNYKSTTLKHNKSMSS